MVVNPKLWREVFERDNGFCQYCGFDLLSDFNAYWVATVDHIKHRSDGGEDEKGNLVLACSSCNGMLSRSNHRKTIEERKAYIMERRTDEMPGYKEWKKYLRT